MKILVGTYFSGFEYETSQLFIKTAKRLGHEVCIAGPEEGRYNTDLPRKFSADIDLPDKKFPELYTYEEVLSKAPWMPDVVLQIEPHFYFTGKKPNGIKSYYWVLDPHRGGLAYRDLALQGSFDAVLLTHMFFAQSYTSKGMRCVFFPFCFDPERERYDKDISPECDIAFPGVSGFDLKDSDFDKKDSDGLQYCNYIPEDAMLRCPYGEYSERAMLLKYLTKDFNVRIYKKYYGSLYSRIIQKGKIGFHRSVNNLPPRIFETMACKRALVADYVDGIEDLLLDKKNAVLYKQFRYHPLLQSFMLDYEALKEKVELLLNNRILRNLIAENGYIWVNEKHKFEDRINTLSEIANVENR